MSKIKSNTMLELIDATVGKICHDLINPVGTAQMALEQINSGIDSNQALKTCLQQTIDRLEIFRSIFRISANADHAMDLIRKYIENNKLNCTLESPSTAPCLLFFAIQKMSSKSSIAFIKNEIILNQITLREEEIKALEGTYQEISAGTIMPYIAQLSIKKPLQIEQIEEKKWKITII